METIDSEVEYFLLKMSSAAKHIAESNSTKDLGSNVAPVGLKMIMHPIKPPMLASHRSLPTFSPKKNLANVILKNGIVLLMTTHEAKGRRFSPMHHKPMPNASREPRTKCMYNL